MADIKECPQTIRRTEQGRKGAEGIRIGSHYNAHVLIGRVKSRAEALEVAIE